MLRRRLPVAVLAAAGLAAPAHAAGVRAVKARPSKCGGTVVSWRAGAIPRLKGFSVLHRAKGAKARRPVTTALVRRAKGGAYTVLHPAGRVGDRYWVTAARRSGRRIVKGPVTVGGRAVTPGRPSKLVGGKQPPGRYGASCGTTSGGTGGLGTGTTPVNPGPGPDASTTPGLDGKLGAARLGVSAPGWYRVPLAELAQAGVDVSRPERLHVTARGVEQAAVVVGGALEFAAEGPDSVYSAQRAYVVTAEATTGLRAERQPAVAAAPAPDETFAATVTVAKRDTYFAGLLGGDVEHFFGPVVSGTTTVNVPTPRVAAAGAPTISLTALGFTTGSHDIAVSVNGQPAGALHFDGATVATSADLPAAIQSGDNTVMLSAPDGDISLVDHLTVRYRRTFKATGDALAMTVPGGHALRATGFTAGGERVVDVTDPAHPVELAATVSGSAGDFAVTATVPGDGPHRLVAFAPGALPAPDSLRPYGGSTWRTPDHAADLVVITSRALAASVQPLVDRRRAEGLNVELVDVQDLVDEFGYGERSPQAVKDFVAYAESSWAGKPRYVLLAGDGTLDPYGHLGLGVGTDVIPVKMLDTSELQSASDAWLADLDGDEVADVPIGRLPFSTPAAMKAMVDKLLAYGQMPPARTAVTAADADPAHDFAGVNAQFRALLPGDWTATEIVRGQDGARGRLLDALRAGPSLVNYVGHGNVNFWAGDVLTADDAKTLDDPARASVYLIMTCLNGYFADPGLNSQAEALLAAPGGAVAAWAASSWANASSQAPADFAAAKALLSGARMGDAFSPALAATPDLDVRRGWNLLGDPSLALR